MRLRSPWLPIALLALSTGCTSQWDEGPPPAAAPVTYTYVQPAPLVAYETVAPGVTYAEPSRGAYVAAAPGVVVNQAPGSVVNVYVNVGGSPTADAPTSAPVAATPAPTADTLPASCRTFFAETNACGHSLTSSPAALARFDQRLRISQGELTIASTVPSERARLADRCQAAADAYQEAPCAR